MASNQVTSRLGFGCVALTSFNFTSQAVDFLKFAYDSGIYYYDTAPIYGGGYSEKILGDFIRTKDRDKLVIATKFGLSNPHPKIPASLALPLNYLRKKIKKVPSYRPSELKMPEIYSARTISREEVQKSLENSLKNLGTDYIDNLMLHEAIPDFLSNDAFEFLLRKKEQGVVRKIGIACNFVNLRNCLSNSVQNWDILQYENGALYNTQDILSKYPNKQHNYHSILRYTYLKDEASAEISSDKKAGYILSKYLHANPKGIVLFSTGNRKNLSQNLSSIQEYY